MATVENVIMHDDLDSRISNGVETVTFYDPRTGQKLEIELGEANRKHLDAHMDKLVKYIDAARKVDAPPAKVVAAQKGQQTKIREWAKANGYTIGDRGRIKADILEAYYAAIGPVQTVTPEAQDKLEEIAKSIEDANTSITEPTTDEIANAPADVEELVERANAEPTAEELAEIETDRPFGNVTNDELHDMIAEINAVDNDGTEQ